MFGKKLLRNLIIIAAIVVFAVLMMTVIDKSSSKMAITYYALTNKPSRSDLQFNVPTGRVVMDSDGTKDIEFEAAPLTEDVETEVEEEEYDPTEPEDDRQHPGEDKEKEEEEKPEGTNIVSILGDSISTFEGTMPSGYSKFYPEGEVDSVEYMWWKIYIDSIGAELGVNGSWSGTLVTGGDGSAGQSDERINALGNKGDPSTIIVYMGTNDVWQGVSQTDFGNAYGTMLGKIKTKYPSAKVICLGLTQLSTDPSKGTAKLMGSTDDTGKGTSIDFSNIIQSKASAAGCTYVSLEDCWSYTEAQSYCIDGMVHPNKDGMRKIAEMIPE